MKLTYLHINYIALWTINTESKYKFPSTSIVSSVFADKGNQTSYTSVKISQVFYGLNGQPNPIRINIQGTEKDDDEARVHGRDVVSIFYGEMIK